MFSVTKIENSLKKIKEFVADATADVAHLPTSANKGTQVDTDDKGIGNNDKVDAGSTCFVITPPSMYVLGNDDVWHLVS